MVARTHLFGAEDSRPEISEQDGSEQVLSEFVAMMAPCSSFEDDGPVPDADGERGRRGGSDQQGRSQGGLEGRQGS